MANKKFVLIYNEDPYSRDFGGNIRVRSLIGELKKYFDLTVIHLPSPKPGPSSKSPSWKKWMDKLIRSFINFSSQKPKTVTQHYLQIPRLKKMLLKHLKHNKADFIQVEHSYFAEIMKGIDFPGIKIMDFHNVHSSMEESHTEKRKWSNYEKKINPGFDLALCCSLQEKYRLFELGYNQVFIFRNGLPFQEPQKSIALDGRSRLLFIGDLKYSPNQRAISHFFQEVHPLINDLNIQVDIVGDFKKKEVKGFTDLENVSFHGYTKDLSEFYPNSIFICPVNTGGGTRIKILDAFMNQAPVVSYIKGAEGIDYEHRLNIMIASNPLEFANHIRSLINEPVLYKTIQAKALKLVQTNYSLEKIGKEYAGFLQKQFGEVN